MWLAHAILSRWHSVAPMFSCTAKLTLSRLMTPSTHGPRGRPGPGDSVFFGKHKACGLACESLADKLFSFGPLPSVSKVALPVGLSSGLQTGAVTRALRFLDRAVTIVSGTAKGDNAGTGLHGSGVPFVPGTYSEVCSELSSASLCKLQPYLAARTENRRYSGSSDAAMGCTVNVVYCLSNGRMIAEAEVDFTLLRLCRHTRGGMATLRTYMLSLDMCGYGDVHAFSAILLTLITLQNCPHTGAGPVT
jgi:hypothetical protein